MKLYHFKLFKLKNMSKRSMLEDDDELSDNEESSLVKEVYNVKPRSFKFLNANKMNKILFIVTVFLVLLSIHILIYSNVKVYSQRMIVGWSRNTSRQTIDYARPNENTTLIEPVKACHEDIPIFLLIVVCSSLINFEARQTIRETWGNSTNFNYPVFEKLHGKYDKFYLKPNNKHWERYAENSTTSDHQLNRSNFNIRVVFLLGVPTNERSFDELQYQINYEHELYGDIIQENFLDSYNNLTIKTVLMLKWANINCVEKVKYIMKCDDDTFVNVPNLIHVLLGGTVPVYNATVSVNDKLSINARSARNRLSEGKNLLLGFKFCSAKPVRDVRSKWYAPNYSFNGEIYPDYLSGTAYLMNFETAKKLYKGSLSTPMFHLEDVYLTGFVANRLKIKRQPHPLFSFVSIKDRCSLRGMITQHKMTPMTVEEAYSFIMNFSTQCSVPKKSYLGRKLELINRKGCK
ncbi:CLUMA_CG009776, isoform A [Clunio marinus]|uniref:Hexosyltransferase n=1 Tax=Clunio marinus TaxID=568069 RepID=A0A1J1I7S1_9DIPT|nr:CLUMA_CG009776, isoform A [Clunio marinus]